MKKFVFVVFLMFSEEIYLFNSRAELKVFIYFPWPTLLTLCLKFNVFLHYLDTMSTVTFKTVHIFLCSNVESCHQSGFQEQYQLMKAQLDLKKVKFVCYWETNCGWSQNFCCWMWWNCLWDTCCSFNIILTLTKLKRVYSLLYYDETELDPSAHSALV